ncbi:MAG: PQQ-binding-like beta-propeller repeat protein [Planctomycetaceae bacterium]
MPKCHRRWAEGMVRFIALLCSATFVVLNVGTLCLAGEADWPMYRHDPHLTGSTTAKGKIRTPAILWEKYLGTSYQPFATHKRSDDGLVDLDGDGRRERFRIEPTSFVVQDENGTELSRINVAGRPLGETVRVVRLFPERPGTQVVVLTHRMDNGEGECRCFSFHRGSKLGELAWTTGPIKDYYSPTIIFDDVDGDGEMEVVTAPHYRVQIFSGRSGQLEAEVPWETGRNYGVLTSRPRENSTHKDLFVISDFMPHVDGIRFSDGKWQHVWGHKYVEPNIPLPNGRERAMRLGPNPIGDFDGDGKEEILCMFSDATIAGGWHLHVRGCESGSLQHDISGIWLWSVRDLDGDRRREIVYTPTSEIRPTEFCDLHVANLTSSGLRDRAVLRGVRPLATIVDVPLSLDTIADNGREDLLAVDLDGDSIDELIAGERTSPGVSEDRYVAIDLNKCKTRDHSWTFERKGHRLNLVHAGPEGARPFIARIRDLDSRTLVDVDSAGKVLSETALGEPAGFVTMPIVVDLDRDGCNEVVVQDAARRIHALRYSKPGAEPDVVWSIAGAGMNAHPGYSTNGNLCVQSADLDNDGLPEVLFAAEDKSGNASLVCADAHGRVQWRYAFEHCPWGSPSAGINYWTIGRFSGNAQHLDVYVDVHRRGRVTNEGFVLSGRNGELVWNERGLVSSETAMPFGGGIPAVADVNGDGRDDIVQMFWTLFASIDGKTGKPIHPPNYLPGPKLFNHWVAYSSPSLADLDGDGRLDVYLNSAQRSRGAYAAVKVDGTPLWIEKHDFDEGSNGYGPVADLDGDGAVEVIVPVIDGHVVCLDGKTGARKWTISAPVTGDVVAADVNGDGLKEVVFAGRDNTLRAVQSRDGSLLWQIEAPGSPIVADVDGDRLIEILCTAPDGKLRIIGEKRTPDAGALPK